MLNNFFSPLKSRLAFCFSTMKVTEVRGQCLVLVKDTQRQLAFMRQVQTSLGTGIVLKIQQNDLTYIGLYNPFQSYIENIQIINAQIPWKKSIQKMVQDIKQQKNNLIFDVQGNILTRYNASQQNLILQEDQKLPKGRRLQMLSPILNICYDLKYGDLLTFKGCRGSGKTSLLINAMHYFASAQNHISLYFNDNPNNRNNYFITKTNRCFCFNNPLPTDIGVYMLGIKTIAVANALRKSNYEVFLTFDNFRRVLEAEWHMLQLLQGPLSANNKTSNMINYNALKLAPISLLNEAYSSCGDHKPKGSLTMAFVNQFQSNLVPEITPYTNNLSHLSTISKNIEFPLHIQTNNNKKIKPNVTINSKEYKNKANQIYEIMRNKVNQYIQQKEDTELRRQIHKNQMQDAPWDYFILLDSQWWLKGLKQFQMIKKQENDEFVKWLIFNIQEQLMSQWKISAKDSFNELLKYIKKNSLKELEKKEYQQFVKQAKMKGMLTVFKKDYLQ